MHSPCIPMIDIKFTFIFLSTSSELREKTEGEPFVCHFERYLIALTTWEEKNPFILNHMYRCALACIKIFNPMTMFNLFFLQESLQNHISETEKQIKQLKCEHEEMVESLTTEHAQKIESMSNEHKAKIQVLSIIFSVKSIDNIHATDY